ncbi:MAG TPA: glycosyltransferase [Thermoplasmata archaeon]|nr:glycosyltransferase [Thermoplasmata archaeon]
MVDAWLLWGVGVGAAVTLLFQGLALLLAFEMPHLYPLPPTRLPSFPRLSVVIAARNEEEAIGDCLDDLLAQEYPGAYEIFVVDGQSTDRTRDVVRSKGERIRLIEEPPLPPGWVGKNWACHCGAQASHSEFLLFTDADMRYHPRALATVVEWAERESADLATVGSRIEMHGFWENVVMPFYTQAVLTYFRTPHVNRPDSSTAMANGQFMLVRRAPYDAMGGHEAIRGSVLEDVKLAQQFRTAGRRLRVAWAPELVSTRMYRNRHEMFEGLLKNVHGVEYSTARQVGFLAALVGFFLLPLFVLPVGLGLGSLPLVLVGLVIWIALFGKHVAFAQAVRGRAAYGLLFPIAVAFYLVLVATSIRQGRARAPLVWKGRAYPRQA